MLLLLLLMMVDVLDKSVEHCDANGCCANGMYDGDDLSMVLLLMSSNAVVIFGGWRLETSSVRLVFIL